MRMEQLVHTLVRRVWVRRDSAVAVELQGLGPVVPGPAMRSQHSIQSQSTENLMKLTLYSMV
jgi:hypothetical protein